MPVSGNGAGRGPSRWGVPLTSEVMGIHKKVTQSLLACPGNLVPASFSVVGPRRLANGATDEVSLAQKFQVLALPRLE
jgi:hypothetical protein